MTDAQTPRTPSHAGNGAARNALPCRTEPTGVPCKQRRSAGCAALPHGADRRFMLATAQRGMRYPAARSRRTVSPSPFDARHWSHACYSPSAAWLGCCHLSTGPLRQRALARRAVPQLDWRLPPKPLHGMKPRTLMAADLSRGHLSPPFCPLTTETRSTRSQRSRVASQPLPSLFFTAHW